MSSAAAAAKAATERLQLAQEQVNAHQQQLSQTQSALQSFKDQQLANQQRALASEAKLTLTVKDKASQLNALKQSLSAAEADLQKLQAESANTKDLQQQVQGLQAELTTEREAHSKLRQQHAAAITEATGTCNSLNAAVKAKSANVQKVAKALSAKDNELQQAKASLQEAQDQAAALQCSVQELGSRALQGKLEQQQRALSDLQQQQTEREQAAADKEEELRRSFLSKDAEYQQASTALAAAEASIRELTVDYEASCAKVAALEATVQELTDCSKKLQQQVLDQMSDLQQQHATTRQALSSKESETAAGITDHESQFDELKQSLSAKNTEVQKVKAALKASKQQVDALQVAAKSLQKASTDEASRQLGVLSNDQSATESVQSEQLRCQAEADSAKISQLEQKVNDESSKVSQLKSHAEHLRKNLDDRIAQYNQLVKQHQALQAMAAEASQEGDQQEEDLRQKDTVIQQLQQQLIAAQRILAEGVEGPAHAHGTGDGRLPLAPAVPTCNTRPIKQAGQSGASPSFRAPSDPNLTPISTLSNMRIAHKQQVLHLPPVNRSLETTRANTEPALSSAQPTATAVSTRGVSSSCLRMPEGSVHNPLAGQPDLDDDHDQISTSKLRPLSPQLSGSINHSDSSTEDEGTAGPVILQCIHDQQVSSTPPSAFTSAADWKQQSTAGQDTLPQKMQQVGRIWLLHYSHFLDKQACSVRAVHQCLKSCWEQVRTAYDRLSWHRVSETYMLLDLKHTCLLGQGGIGGGGAIVLC